MSMKTRITVAVSALAVMSTMFSAPPAAAVLEPGAVGLAQRTAQEGIVMVQNDDAVLPLSPDQTVSIFGRVQVNYFPVGYGSGGDVKMTYVTNLLQGMRRNPGITVNEQLAKVYEEWCASHKPDDGGWAQWPLSHKEMPLSDQVVSQAAAASDTAVVVLGRSAGESYDQQYAKGSFFLTDAETQMLSKVNAAFDKVVVLLNIGNLIDMSWVAQYNHIKSVMFVWQGGQESGNAVAAVLAGDESPSGKLPDTVAYEHSDYPTDGNFGQANPIYQEDIFLGYRYFETFAKDRVLYPFGFGLSYTTFDLKNTTVAKQGSDIKVTTTVVNTGNRPGKEVVQAYYGAPQGQLGKAAKTLAAYAKTGTLQPGASETVTLTYPIDQMASYDDAGKAGHKSAWVLEAGEYPIYVGTSVANSQVSGSYNQGALAVTKQAVQTLAPTSQFERWTAQTNASGAPVLNKHEAVPQQDMAAVRAEILAAADVLPVVNLHNRANGENKGIKLIDVYDGRATMDEFVAQLSITQLAYLTTGPGSMDPVTSVLGSAGVLGGYLPELQAYGIEPETLTDGPSGIRIAESATLLPIGTLLASTWNDQLVEDLYAAVGAEMVRNGSSSTLSPGMNIHRDPLCGRNFEYFSEDPLLAGQIGAAFVRGIQSQGVAATPKHYAVNNQEQNRSQGNSQVSERALREIYLKAFEVMIRASQPRMMMTSYNNVNGYTSSSNWQMVTKLARQEFGFDGVVMTDWGGNGSLDPTGATSDASRIRAGTDVYEQGSATVDCLVSLVNQQPGGCFGWFGPDPDPPSDAWLRLGELQRSAINVLNDVMKSHVFRTKHHLPLYDYTSGEYEPSWRPFQVSQPAHPRPSVDRIYLNGKPLSGFHANTVSYLVYTTDFGNLPQVTVAQPANVTVEIAQATVAVPVATVKVTSLTGDQSLYRIVFHSETSRPIFHPADISADLAGLQIDGAELDTFYPATYDYTLWVSNPATAVVTATAPPGVSYTVSREGSLVTVRSESATQARAYRIQLGKIDATKQPQSDAFNQSATQPFWSVEKASGGVAATTTGTKITPSPAWWGQSADDDLKDVLVQPAQGSWTATTKISYGKLPVGPGAEFGIAVKQGSSDFVKLSVQGFKQASADAVLTDQARVYVQNYFSGSPNSNTQVVANAPETCMDFGGFQWCFGDGGPAMPAENGTIWLRVVKSAESYTFFYSVNGTSFTGIGGTQAAAMVEPQIALYATTLPGSSAAPVTFESLTIANATPPTFPAAASTSIAASGTTKVLAQTRFAERGSFTTPSPYAPGDPEAPTAATFSGGEFNNFLVNVDVARAGYYTVAPRVSSTNSATQKWSFFLQLDGVDAASWSQGGSTSGWQALEGQVVYLTPGKHKLRLHCWTTNGFSLSSLDFTPNPVSRSALSTAIAIAKMINQDAYTKASWARVADATAAAEAAYVAVGSNLAAEQSAVDAALQALNAAIEALTLKPVSTPSIVAPPQVSYSDSVASGTTATVTSGQWSAIPNSISYQWLRNNQPIAGATAPSYKLTDADADTKLSVQVRVLVAGQEAGVYTTTPVKVASLPQPVAGDKAALSADIAQVNKIDRSKYTPASWAAVTAALAEVERVLGLAQPDAATVNAARSGLLAALAALTPASNPKATDLVKVTTKSVTVKGAAFKKNSKPKVSVQVKLSKGVAKGKVTVYVGSKAVKTVTVSKATTAITLPAKYKKAIKVKAQYKPAKANVNGTQKLSAAVTIKVK